MRRVEWVRVRLVDNPKDCYREAGGELKQRKTLRVEDRMEGEFHCFGSVSCEAEDSVAMDTVAIVEDFHGEIWFVHPLRDRMRFIDRPSKAVSL